MTKKNYIPNTRIVNLIGSRYGRLLVIAFSGKRKNNRYWECQCDCGVVTVVAGGEICRGTVVSCGCLRKEKATTHGMYKSSEFKIWQKMKSRCFNENHHGYKDYGGRGITVCNRWLKFENFLEDIGNRPSPRHSIDRIDVNGNYEPSNCKWSTLKEQARNKQNTFYIEIDNKKMCLSEFCEVYSLKRSTARWRIKNGWCLAKVISG